MAKDAPRDKQAQVEEVIGEGGKVYLSPCQIRCPLDIDIQRNHTMIALLPFDPEEAARRMIEIGNEVYQKSPLFPLLCAYICGLCEKECNYKDETGSVRRRMMMRLVAKEYLKYLKTMPALPVPTGERVAVVGGGAGGLMCAYVLSKKGYRVTILERNPELGGAMRLIPAYRLPQEVIDSVISSLLRVAHIEVRLGAEVGDGGMTIDDLKKEGYRAVFIASGTPAPRPLTFGRERLSADLEGVMFGLNLLYEVLQGNVPLQFYQGKKVIVVGGGNVAFDVARTARRLGGEVTLVCLECADKSCKDGIPADDEEIEGATEEGIEMVYSRGVEEIVGKDGKFSQIRCPRCTSVFDDDGRFNPQCDRSDVVYIGGDVLLITIGQGPERTMFQNEGLLNEQGRLDIDPVTLMSNLKEGVFIGGDVRRVGFASEAMRDGAAAAESIDRYLKGEDMKSGRKDKEYQTASIPERVRHKLQPELKWTPASERLNFEPFEKEYTLAEVIEEARRCLCCGPCKSCKACVMLGLQPEIPEIEVNSDLCSGCGVCVAVCPYGASRLETVEGKLRSVVDDAKCKRCGVCVTVCPSGARTIKDALAETVADTYTKLSGIGGKDA
jgi:NADPH-dependent glutamate synthase beta subunit-like oxidoreductase/NAD-dependent dihydropyrimidine dehydrogenase PreA subunit